MKFGEKDDSSVDFLRKHFCVLPQNCSRKFGGGERLRSIPMVNMDPHRRRYLHKVKKLTYYSTHDTQQHRSYTTMGSTTSSAHGTKSSKHNEAQGEQNPDSLSKQFADQSPREYSLTKLRPGCTGMFWRADPRPNGYRLASNSHWPRDGAQLRGYKIEHKGQSWLVATHVKQERGEWKTAPRGAALPFEYNNHYCLRKAHV